MSTEETRETYLGDGVYASAERGMIRLTADGNVIYLEPHVLTALNDYVARITGGQNGRI